MSSKKKQKNYICFVCNKVIPNERVEALQMLQKNPDEYTHVACSVESCKKGIYFGEHGTGELKLVSEVYNDSIRDIMSNNSSADEELD